MKNLNKESIKTNIIVFLITSILMFSVGMWYNQHQNEEVKSAAAAIVKDVKVNAVITPSK